MKKPNYITWLELILFACCIITLLTSCATVCGGKIDTCQKNKPETGKRKLRTAAFVIDILCWPPLLVVDFATSAIYKPCSTAK